MILHVVGQAEPGTGEMGVGSDSIAVKLLQPAQARQLGQAAWLAVENGNSCVGRGRLRGKAYVVARVAGKLRGRTLLSAKAFRRSRWDDVWRLFGRETFSAPNRLADY